MGSARPLRTHADRWRAVSQNNLAADRRLEKKTLPVMPIPAASQNPNIQRFRNPVQKKLNARGPYASMAPPPPILLPMVFPNKNPDSDQGRQRAKLQKLLVIR